MKTEVLILGQGFAGTALALRLEMAGIPYKIGTETAHVGASRKAVGLVNPVTGRRMARTEGFDHIFPEAVSFYRKAHQLLLQESESTISFLKPYPIWKALHSVEEVNFLTAKSASPGFENLISIVTCEQANLPQIFKDTVAWCRIESGYHLEPAHYLDSALFYFKEKNRLIDSPFEKNSLISVQGGWQWNNQVFTYVVSCLGLHCPWVGAELIPLKGEVYEFSGFPVWEDHILKTEKFMIPLANGLTRAGSTYAFDAANEDTTAQGLEEIIRDLKPEIKKNLRTEKAWAGLRATTETRKPLVKQVEPGIFAFNGLGTKGISHAPTASLEVMGMMGL